MFYGKPSIVDRKKVEIKKIELSTEEIKDNAVPVTTKKP